MSTTKITLLLAAALCLPFVLVFAAETEEAQEVQERVLVDVEEDGDEIEEYWEEEDEDLEPLGTTVKLEFKLVPEEDDDEPLSVLCAMNEYALAARMTTPDFSFDFGVRGHVEFADDELLLMTFDTQLVTADENEGVEGEVHAEGSAEVPLGKVVTLAQLGDKSLTVHVTEVD